MAAESLTLYEGQATVATDVVVRGAEFTYTFTLDGSGSIAGATLAAAVRRQGSPQTLLDKSMSIADATARTVTLALTEANTETFQGDRNNPAASVRHVLDVTMDLGGVTSIFGPLLFAVRSPA